MAKRGQNEGSIYKRKDGRWVGVVSLGYKGGKRHRKYFYGDTRRGVQQLLTNALQAQHAGLSVAPERQTIEQYLRHWLEHTVRRNVRPKTFQSYEQLTRIHIIPGLGRLVLAKLSPQQVQAFINDRLAIGLSPRTVQYLHAVLRRALGQALKWGLVTRNVATLVEAPTVRPTPIVPLMPEEAKALLFTVRDDRLESLYSVALAIGLRQGEVLGLRWKDVDLANGNLRVRSALQWINGKPEFVEPKTERSRRTIALPNIAVDALRRHRTRQLEERLLAGSRWQENELVFATSKGSQIHPRNLVRHFHRALERAGLPKKRFHDLRHTCASLLLAQGVQPRVVMEILCHSQISLTMDTYSHVIPTLAREAANQMDVALRT